MARLIKTEKEVEGHYTEQWVVVEEDEAIDQWPQGPGAVVGRPAPRQDGHSARARRRRSTPPTSRCRECCTRPCCAAPSRARA